MKKVLTILMTIGMSICLEAGVNDTVFSFSTKGQDMYADGTRVVDGECYALVWAADGAEFKGFLNNGSLVDEQNNRIVLVAPVAHRGHCPKTVVQLNEDFVKALGKGKFAVVLLDTRVIGRNGNVKLAGLDENGRPTSVSAMAIVNYDVRLDTGFADADAADAAVASTHSKAPADAVAPHITRVNVDHGLVAITFNGVYEGCRYNVKGGVDPNHVNEIIFNYDFNGEPEADGTMQIVFAVDEAAGCGFFKIVRR